ncbi:MAG: hypothetical protein IJD12_00590 [Tidjanibacter sp.]|nr:hypothetical protein [Tidjanibacter sp.]MBR3931234.1 hypothetical protein [Tidjanibacter sp.]
MKIKSLVIALAAVLVSATALAQDPVNEAKKMYNEGVTLFKAKNYAEALPILEKTVEAAMEADAMEVAEAAQKLIPTSYFQLGLAKMKAGNVDAALVDLNKANDVALLYNNASVARNAKSAISQVYRVKGANAFNNKDYATAVVDFAKGYEVNPQDTKLALNLAMSYCELKDFENGVKVYTDIIALEKRHSRFAEPAAEAKKALSNYLLVKAQEENAAANKEAAYATLETLINADPMNAENQMHRLQMAAANQDWDNVIAWSDLAAAIQPTPEAQSDVYYLVGVAQDSKNNNTAAIDAYKQVVAGDKVEAATKRIKELQEFIKAEKEAAK